MISVVIRCSLVALWISVASSNIHAAAVQFLLDDTGGGAGAAFESAGTFTTMGVTVSVATSSTFPGSTGAAFSANGSGSGVNTAGTSADEASELDAGETATFTFSFSSPTTVSLTSFDFQGVGSAGGGDAALVSVNGGATVTLETGVANFNGSSDTWTPNIALSSGDTLAISSQDLIRFEAFTLEITAVPEPSSFALFGLAGTFLAVRRKRRARMNSDC